jgi:DNA-directed RNA polymerase specialized sigma24 family protein
MRSEARPSVSEWIVGAKQGDSRAVQALWQRYFDQLVHLARRKLADAPRRVADEEDVALSAFAAFCHGARQGRFPKLSGRDDLWRLLITMTAQKAIDQKRYLGRPIRGGGRVHGESALDAGKSSLAEQGLAGLIGDAPTPEFAALVAEQCTRLLAELNDDLRPVALAKMQDYTNQEIAASLDCSVSTVERSLRLIRRIWEGARGRG